MSEAPKSKTFNRKGRKDRKGAEIAGIGKPLHHKAEKPIFVRLRGLKILDDKGHEGTRRNEGAGDQEFTNLTSR